MIRNSLRIRFTIIFLSLAILPQILTGIILGNQVFSSLEAESLTIQQEVAAGLARRIEAFFSEREDELQFMDEVIGLGSLDRESQRNALSNMLLNHRAYQQLILLNATGQEQIYLSRSEVVLDSELQSRGDEEVFLIPVREKKVYYGPVKYNDTIREPLMDLAVPILDRRSGEVQFVLIGSLRFKTIWELIANLELSPEREVFVIDEGGQVIAHRNPSVVLQITQFDLPEMDGRGTGLTDQPSIIGSYLLPLGQQNIIVVSQETLSSALALAIFSLRFTFIMLLVSLVPIIALVFLIEIQIIRPIVALAASARAISSGERTREVQVERSDELGDLALAFNSMTRQLSELIGSLENKIADRTQDLDELLAKQRVLAGELKAKNNQLERFIYTVSHDLKSPLITIKGYLGYIEHNIRAGNQDQVGDDLVRVHQAASKMQEMLDDLLEFSRVGRVVTTREAISMDVIAQEAVESVAGRLIEQNITVEIEPDLPSVFGDHKQLRELIENLLDNAAKFMGDQPEPRIEIGSQGGDGQIQFYIRDNGIGIDPQYRDRVFNLFEQLDPGVEGSGVGLAIVRRIVETHGGIIWVESEGLGKGSTFYFCLSDQQELEERKRNEE